MSDLIERLWEAHASSQQRVLGSDIFAEAATEITRLQEALAAAEAEIERLLPIEAEAAEGREINGELRAKLADARPIIEGLLTAYIEADEDGLTEHAEPIIAAQAFLRSLSNDEAPK